MADQLPDQVLWESNPPEGRRDVESGGLAIPITGIECSTWVMLYTTLAVHHVDVLLPHIAHVFMLLLGNVQGVSLILLSSHSPVDAGTDNDCRSTNDDSNEDNN